MIAWMQTNERTKGRGTDGRTNKGMNEQMNRKRINKSNHLRKDLRKNIQNRNFKTNSEKDCQKIKNFTKRNLIVIKFLPHLMNHSEWCCHQSAHLSTQQLCSPYEKDGWINVGLFS